MPKFNVNHLCGIDTALGTTTFHNQTFTQVRITGGGLTAFIAYPRLSALQSPKLSSPPPLRNPQHQQIGIPKYSLLPPNSPTQSKQLTGTLYCMQAHIHDHRYSILGSIV
jgi:hypothetical protein